MERTRKLRPRFGLRTIFVIVTGFALYVAAYRATLHPWVVADVAHLGIVIEGSREPNYRFFGDAGRIIFAPIEKIDYWIRPDYWDTYSDVPADLTREDADEL